MPTNIFYNLKEEKKQAITNALVNLYSTKIFEQVTVSNIVQLSNIARGSFYQYFEDLEDAYVYTITNVIQSNIKKNIKYMDTNNIEIFLEEIKSMFKQKMYEMLHGEKNEIQYLLMRQIKKSDKGIEIFVKNINLMTIPIDIVEENNNEQLIIILNIVKAIITSTSNDLFKTNDFDKFVYEFNLKIDIIKEGSKIIFNK